VESAEPICVLGSKAYAGAFQRVVTGPTAGHMAVYRGVKGCRSVWYRPRHDRQGLAATAGTPFAGPQGQDIPARAAAHYGACGDGSGIACVLRLICIGVRFQG